MQKNVMIDGKEKVCIVSINTKMFQLDVIYAASYVFIDRAYVILDSNSKGIVKVMLKPKKEEDLEKLGLEFDNELIKYAFYKKTSEKNKAVKEAIMQRALITNDPSIFEEDALFDEDLDKLFDDPEGIAIPWEEKHNKKSKK
jgi:His-Xaa-Ser system protein HxsD